LPSPHLRDVTRPLPHTGELHIKNGVDCMAHEKTCDGQLMQPILNILLAINFLKESLTCMVASY
jgi:hypothetical protein